VRDRLPFLNASITPPHRDPLVGLPRVLALTRRLTGTWTGARIDLPPRKETGRLTHFPFAGLVHLAVADLELEAREAPRRRPGADCFCARPERHARVSRSRSALGAAGLTV
jgi:hypothetical protein